LIVPLPATYWRNTDCFGNSATLVALQPFLTGQVREHVDYVIEHPDHEMWAMPFYSAVQDWRTVVNEAAELARRLFCRGAVKSAAGSFSGLSI
jgi:hypothetical protein